MMKRKTNIAIFASGTGSNAKAVINYSLNSNYNVELIVSNKENAGVLAYSKKYGIDALIIDKTSFYKENKLLYFLEEKGIELIILAGFLWLIPKYLLEKYSNSIINIHPSLLPKYGGKGMYGINVHNAVLENNDKFSGITIHIVNEEYDKGDVLFQKSIDISKEKTAEDIASAVLKIEHEFFPKIIEQFVENL